MPGSGRTTNACTARAHTAHTTRTSRTSRATIALATLLLAGLAVVAPNTPITPTTPAVAFPADPAPCTPITPTPPEPTLTSVSPDGGPDTGGTAVTLTGTGLTGATEVFFGDVDATDLVVVDDGTITVTSPPSANGADGPTDVTVETPGGPAVLSDGFEYGAPVPPTPPGIASVTPDSGPTTGGTSVTIQGTGLTGAQSVTIGGAPATDVTVVDDDELTAVTPAGTAGPADIRIVTASGTTSGSGAFTYTEPTPPATPPTAAAIAPAQGPIAGGTVATITGSGFVANGTSVLVDGVVIPSSSVTVNGPASLSFVTPAHAAGDVEVAVGTDGGTAQVPGGFTYLTSPTIVAVSPGFGPTSGGTLVTVTGSGFDPADTTVVFGGIIAQDVTVQSASSLTAVTPAAPAGTATVSVETPGGSASLPGGFTWEATPGIGGIAMIRPSTRSAPTTPTTPSTPSSPSARIVLAAADVTCEPPTVTSVDPTVGSSAGGTRIRLFGAGFTGATAVAFGGVAGTDLVVVGDTELDVTTPAHVADGTDVVVTGPGGSSTAPVRFTFADPAAVVTPPPTTTPSPTATPTTPQRTFTVPPIGGDRIGGGLAFTGTVVGIGWGAAAIAAIVAGIVLGIRGRRRRW